MSGSILDRLDAAINDTCPCGAPPRDTSPYCSWDCEPTHHSVDTISDIDGTPMRWRPDLVTEVDDAGRELVESFRRGQFNAHVFVYDHDAQPAAHLRLDDGNRFVGLDVTDEQLYDGVAEQWNRLERELTDQRRTIPAPRDGADPWAGILVAWQRAAERHMAELDRQILGTALYSARPGETVTFAFGGNPSARRMPSVSAGNTGGGASGGAGQVFIAPLGTTDPADFRELGTMSDGGITWDSENANPLADIRALMDRRALTADLVISDEAVERLRAMTASIPTAQPNPGLDPDHPLARAQARRRTTAHGRPQRPPRQLGRR